MLAEKQFSSALYLSTSGTKTSLCRESTSPQAGCVWGGKLQLGGQHSVCTEQQNTAGQPQLEHSTACRHCSRLLSASLPSMPRLCRKDDSLNTARPRDDGQLWPLTKLEANPRSLQSCPLLNASRPHAVPLHPYKPNRNNARVLHFVVLKDRNHTSMLLNLSELPLILPCSKTLHLFILSTNITAFTLHPKLRWFL